MIARIQDFRKREGGTRPAPPLMDLKYIVENRRGYRISGRWEGEPEPPPPSHGPLIYYRVGVDTGFQEEGRGNQNPPPSHEPLIYYRVGADTGFQAEGRGNQNRPPLSLSWTFNIL